MWNKIADALHHPTSIALWGITVGIIAALTLFNTQSSSLQKVQESVEASVHSIRQSMDVRASEQNILFKIIILAPNIDTDLAKKMAGSILREANETQEDINLVLALIAVESYFNPTAVSYTGALGLMQTMPFHSTDKNGMCKDFDLRNDIDENIKCGIIVYQKYKRECFDMRATLIAYNEGPKGPNVEPAKRRWISTKYSDKVITIYNRLQSYNW